jgi:nucleotide-binding universal stress UspA family protein
MLGDEFGTFASAAHRRCEQGLSHERIPSPEEIMKSQAGRIVVGYDGSDHSEAALKWAAAEAERRGRPLTVLHVLDYLGWIPSPMGPFGWPEVEDERVVRIAQSGADRARRMADLIDVSAITRVAQVPGTLIEFSRDAELLVVGTRGHGELAGAVLGSVAFAVSAHAQCPVVVVRGEAALPGPGRPVVVGVDGSARSDEAVRYAADVAAAARAPLTVVSAYRTLTSEAWAEAYPYLEAEGRPEFDTAARRSAATAASTGARTARDAYPGLDITERVVEGLPATVLANAADRAGLLVVGSRGHGGFTGLVLGSVSHALIHCAPCPVTVIHGAKVLTQEPNADRADQAEPSAVR